MRSAGHADLQASGSGSGRDPGRPGRERPGGPGDTAPISAPETAPTDRVTCGIVRGVKQTDTDRPPGSVEFFPPKAGGEPSGRAIRGWSRGPGLRVGHYGAGGSGRDRTIRTTGRSHQTTLGDGAPTAVSLVAELYRDRACAWDQHIRLRSLGDPLGEWAAHPGPDHATSWCSWGAGWRLLHRPFPLGTAPVDGHGPPARESEQPTSPSPSCSWPGLPGLRDRLAAGLRRPLLPGSCPSQRAHAAARARAPGAGAALAGKALDDPSRSRGGVAPRVWRLLAEGAGCTSTR